MTDAFDLASIDTVRDCNVGADIELKHPTTSKGTGVFFTVLGRDSDAFRDHVKEQNDADERREFMARKRGREPEPKLSDQQEAEAVDLLAAVITGWYTLTPAKKKGDPPTRKDTVNFGGEELAFSGLNAKKILRERLWVRRQVDAALGDMENFIKT